MEAVDNILEYIWSLHGKAPDQLATLERQAIAAGALIYASRRYPERVSAIISSRPVRNVAQYVARHPIASIASYVLAGYSNSTTRKRWAGMYTREVETVAGAVIFGQTHRAVRFFARYPRNLFNPYVAKQIGRSLLRLSRFNFPKIPRRFIINRFTLSAFFYLRAHPVAALTAYFAAKQIDWIYRPQFFGAFSEEVIAASLFPALAHGPQHIPTAIRGTGAAINYGARGLAAITEWAIGPGPVPPGLSGPGVGGSLLTRISTPPPPRGPGRTGALGPRNLRPLAGLSGGLALEFFTLNERRLAGYQERDPALWASYPGAGLVVAGALTAASYRRGWLDGQILPALPRVAAWVTKGSWFTTAALKVYGTPYFFAWWWGWGAGLAFMRAIPAGPILAVEAATGLGFISPFFQTGTLRGAAIIYHSWWLHLKDFGAWLYKSSANVLWRRGNLFNVLSRFRGVQGIADVLRFFGARTAASGVQQSWRQLGSVARGGATALRLGARGAGATLGFLGRTVGSSAVGAAAAPGMVLGVADFAIEMADAEQDLRERVFGQLRSLEFLEREGVYLGPPVSNIRARIIEIYQERPDRNRLAFWRGQLDFVRSLQSHTDFPQARATLAGLVEGLPSIAAYGLDSAYDLLSSPINVVDDRPRPWWAQPPRRLRPPPTTPRDARGRFTRLPSQLPPIPVLPPTSFRENLDYINRVADLFAQARASNFRQGSIGVVSRGGGHPGGRNRNNWLFKGRDRNLLLQTLRDLQAMIARDQLAASGKTTTKISTRELMLPPGDPGGSVAAAVVIRALQEDASLVRNPGPGGGYYSLEN